MSHPALLFLCPYYQFSSVTRPCWLSRQTQTSGLRRKRCVREPTFRNKSFSVSFVHVSSEFLPPATEKPVTPVSEDEHDVTIVRTSEVKHDSEGFRVFEFGREVVIDENNPLGEGTYGSVFPGRIPVQGDKVVVKISKSDDLSRQYGHVELYMNRLMSRTCSDHVAEFLGSFYVDDRPGLVWKFESNQTLWDLLQGPSWMDEVERALFGQTLETEEALQRRLRIFRDITSKLVSALACLQRHKVVHRDIKPMNVIVGERGQLKLIDFGCAVDFTTNVGYDANKGPCDPRYMPPEEFVIKAFYDRFDMYSLGITLMQIAFPYLRSDAAVNTLEAELKHVHYNLEKWLQRRLVEAPADASELQNGLMLLNDSDKAAWDLLRRLIAERPRNRYSAAAALAESRYLRGPAALGPFSQWSWNPFHAISDP